MQIGKKNSLKAKTKARISKTLKSKNTDDMATMNLIQELRDLKNERDTLELRTRQQTYSLITRAYGLALVCKNDDDSWQDFCREKFFESRKQKPKSHKPEEALRFFLAYLFGGAAKERQKLSKYNRALSAAFSEDLPPDVVEKMLNEEGIEELAKKNAKKKLSDVSSNAERKIIYQKEPFYIKKLAKMGLEGEFLVSTHIIFKSKDASTINIKRKNTDIIPL